jgi:drug/metabolite transporter (DMT)-like permease
MNLIIFIFLASIAIQVPNILAMKYFLGESSMSIKALKISLYTIPFSIIVSYSYAMFYGEGISKLSYPTLQVIAFSGMLIMSMLVQAFLLKNKDIQASELIGMLFVLVGISIIIFKK